MNLEAPTKESPLEKAKRLKAEKESKDKERVEGQTKKLENLFSQKKSLEIKLDEIDSKIESFRSEAHETRDTMKEAGLNTDEEFKDEYNATISEVAVSLNELRNERNQVLVEMEKINSDIEKFEADNVAGEKSGIEEFPDKEAAEEIIKISANLEKKIDDFNKKSDDYVKAEGYWKAYLEINRDNQEKMSGEEYKEIMKTMDETRKKAGITRDEIEDNIRKIKSLLENNKKKYPEEEKIKGDLKEFHDSIKNKYGGKKNEFGELLIPALINYNEAKEQQERYGKEIPNNIKREYFKFQADAAKYEVKFWEAIKSLGDITENRNIKELQKLLEFKGIENNKIINEIKNFLKNIKNHKLLTYNELSDNNSFGVTINMEGLYSQYEKLIKGATDESKHFEELAKELE